MAMPKENVRVTLPSDPLDGLDIIEAMDRKRKQLEQEIIKFKAKKEKEYREYELMLRHEKAKVRKDDEAASEKDSAQSDPARSPQSHKERFKSSAPKLDIESDLRELNKDENAKPSIPGPGPFAASPRREMKERDKEFQGLFTPGYLPLIDSPSNSSRGRSKETPLTPRIEVNTLAPNTHNEVQQISSSAIEQSIRPLRPLSPHHARPLAFSAPQEQSVHQRRDSSRSDASASSLRSSLRDPSQPKSPKRVLFSIDDAVVSPSTSPVAQRRNTMPVDKLSPNPNGENPPEKFEIIKSKKGKKKSISSGKGATSNSPKTQPATNGTRPNGWPGFRSPRQEQSSEKNQHSPLMGGDDFEKVENDDELFTFDEDLDTSEPSRVESSSRGVAEMLSDEDEDLRTKEPLTGSSPHAGSLPIEIKWPGRRESGS